MIQKKFLGILLILGRIALILCIFATKKEVDLVVGYSMKKILHVRNMLPIFIFVKIRSKRMPIFFNN